MNGITTRVVTHTSPEYQQIWDVREEVLRKPLGMSLKNEDLSGDAEDKIVIAVDNDKVIGCVMMHPKENGVLKLRAMGVYEQYQGKGVGRLLIHAAEKEAAGDGYKKIDLHARMVAKVFYEKLGYTPVGDIFIEVGIPHVLMEKEL